MNPTPPATALQIIQQRMLNALMPAVSNAADPTAAERAAVAAAVATAHHHAETLAADGTWPDVDYKDAGRAKWKAMEHLNRVKALALGYRLAPTDTALGTKARAALARWVALDLKNPNWWFNDIGAPQELGAILLLLEPALTAEEKKAALAVLGRRGLGMTGQNRVWLSGIVLEHACLAGDHALAQQAVNSIASTLAISGDEGIQPDFSFYQHGHCLYNGGYGLGFAVDCARYVAYTRGTDLAFPAATVQTLERYLLEGQLWMLRAGTFDYSACGREITRPVKGQKVSGLAGACTNLALLDDANQGSFTAAAARISASGIGTPGEPDGDRYFWRAAFLVHRRPAYYFSLRMARADLCCSDALINGENKRSQYLGDGATYLLRSGAEFSDLFGAWDWRRVPGTTNRADAPFEGETNAKGEGSFAGAATDGRCSVAAMDFANAARGKTFPAKELTARKAWFCFDHEIVCLGAGIAESADHPVRTSINQCLLHGPVSTAADRAGAQSVPARDLTGPTWVHHDGVGYWIPGTSTVHLSAGDQTGSWRDCTDVEPATPVTRPVFNLWIDHGTKPQDASYEYTLLPDTLAVDMPAYAAANPVTVLSNTPALQAVRHTSANCLGAAFYKPGTLAVVGGLTLTVDQACIVLISDLPGGRHRIALCKPDTNPDHPGTVTVTLNKVAILFKLPGGLHAGESIQQDP